MHATIKGIDTQALRIRCADITTTFHPNLSTTFTRETFDQTHKDFYNTLQSYNFESWVKNPLTDFRASVFEQHAWAMVASPIEGTLSSILNGTDNFPRYYITTDEEVAAFEDAESAELCSQ